MNLELVGALNELERERGISKEILLEAIEAAIVSAYKRNYGTTQNVRVELDDKTGRMQVFVQKDVVEEVNDPAAEMSLAEARERDPNYQLGDVVEVEVTPAEFGRIAAQTAKQVVIQRIREAERNLIYEEYASRVEDIVTGIVQRNDHRNVLVDLGRVEALMPPPEQMPGEPYYHGQRLKVYITEVRLTTKGPQVHVSRTHPGLLKRLFELEVPEIHDGVVEIKAVSREAGNRSKVAVWSRDENVDPVGACVGPRGIRVQSVVQELRGEKIDIIQWHPDVERFVAHALSPARVVRVFIHLEEKTARVVVPDNQLSLAIGREGQNARLAARLTGFKIDIKSESQMAELALLEAQRAFDEAEEKLRARREAEARAKAAAQEAEPAVQEEADAGFLEEEVLTARGPEAGEGLVEEPAPEAEPAAEDYPEELAGEDLLVIEDEPLPEVEEGKRKGKAPAAGVKPKKGRATRREEMEEVMEVLDEEEPLPTLFGGDEAGGFPADDGGAKPVVVVGEEAGAAEAALESPAPAAGKGKKDKKKAKKRVLKDLSELAEVDLEDL